VVPQVSRTPDAAYKNTPIQKRKTVTHLVSVFLHWRFDDSFLHAKNRLDREPNDRSKIKRSSFDDYRTTGFSGQRSS